MKVVCVKVDPLRPKTKELLTALQKDCLPGDRLYFPDDGVWWIAYHQRAAVAFACVAPSRHTAQAVYLGRCGVVKAARGQGIQRRLIRIRLAWAKRKGYKWAVSDTTDNVPSSNNLIACGFRLYTPEYKHAYVRSLYWKRAI